MDKVARALELDVTPDSLDDNGELIPYVWPMFEASLDDRVYGDEPKPEEFTPTLRLDDLDDNEITAGYCPGGSCSGGICKPANNDRLKWTQRVIKGLTVENAILPGTHNSGFDKEQSNQASPEVCQDVSPFKQLEWGIRVLDLRIRFLSGYPLGDPRRFSIYHNGNSSRTIEGDILNAVNTFRQRHGAWRELIILDFHQFDKFNDAAHIELSDIIQRVLQSSILPYQYRPICFGVLNVTQMCTVVAYAGGPRHAKFWPGVHHRWHRGSPSQIQLAAFIRQVALEGKPPGQLRSIQAATYNILHNPIDLSEELMGWFSGDGPGTPIQGFYIINTDWSLRNRLVDNCIYGSAQRNGARSVTEKTTSYGGASNDPYNILWVDDDTYLRINLPRNLGRSDQDYLICCQGKGKSILSLDNTDFGLESLELFPGDMFFFRRTEGETKWRFVVPPHYTPRDSGQTVPTPAGVEKFIHYAVGTNNFVELIKLPSNAYSGRIMVTSSATDEVATISNFNVEGSNGPLLLRKGQKYIFEYRSIPKRWYILKRP